jgi:hypothetical protein
MPPMTIMIVGVPAIASRHPHGQGLAGTMTLHKPG